MTILLFLVIIRFFYPMLITMIQPYVMTSSYRGKEIIVSFYFMNLRNPGSFFRGIHQ